MNFKKIICPALAALCLAGCSSPVTDSSVNGEKTVITMMFTNELPNLEKLVESTYTDIDLKIETNAAATIDGEMERRLRNGHGNDLVTSSLASGDIMNYLVDLSADEYISAYEAGIMHKTSKDGRNYFIPLPAQYYGYIYKGKRAYGTHNAGRIAENAGRSKGRRYRRG